MPRPEQQGRPEHRPPHRGVAEEQRQQKSPERELLEDHRPERGVEGHLVDHVEERHLQARVVEGTLGGAADLRDESEPDHDPQDQQQRATTPDRAQGMVVTVQAELGGVDARPPGDRADQQRDADIGQQLPGLRDPQRPGDVVGGEQAHGEDQRGSHDLDIRDREGILGLFRRYGGAIALVVHTAAQPSHDWAAREPFVDFDINAVGTLNVLEANACTRVERRSSSRRRTRSTATARTRSRSSSSRRGGRSTPSTRTRTASARTCRSTPPAQPLRRFEGRRRRARAGVRPLLRAPHGVLPRRHADRPEPLGRGAARLPRLRHAVRHDRPAVQGLRLQGQAGPRRDPQPRPDPRVRRVLSRAARRRGLQHRRRPRSATRPCSRRSQLSQEIAGRSSSGRTRRTNRIGDHIWWIGDNGRFESHYPVAARVRRAAASCRRSTTRTSSAGGSAPDRPPDAPARLAARLRRPAPRLAPRSAS